MKHSKKGKGFGAVFRRELEMFVSNRTFAALSLGLPVFAFVLFIALFSKGGTIQDVPIAVLDMDNTSLSRQLVRMIDAAPAPKVAYKISDMAEGERMMKEGKIDAIVDIPANLEKDVYSNIQTHVGAYVNGVNLTKNGILSKDIQTVLVSFSSGIQAQKLVTQGVSEVEAANLMMPVYFERHVLFNPYVNYAYYLLPSFLPVMLMMFILITTIYSIGTELKNGTAPQWLETANDNVLTALAGKLMPYTIIFVALTFMKDTILFQYFSIPLRGSIWMLTAAGIVYVLAYQALGVFLISWLSNMRLALSIGGGYSVLAFTFSGLTFPFLAMGKFMSAVGFIFPLTFYTEIFVDQAMRGAPVANSLQYLAYMMIFMLLPFMMLGRIRKISTDEKFWGRV